MGYTKDIVKGLSWISALRGITRGLSFVRILIIARLLTPSQFGLFGVASLVLSLVEVFMETGVNIFLIQKKGNIDKYVNSLWIVSIIRGIFITIIILISAPFIVSFFNAPNSLGLLFLISIVPLIRGFINPAIILFQKNLKFSKEFYFRSAIFLAETLVSVLLVFLLRSPVGLVIGMIVSAVFEVILSFMVITLRPKFKFEKMRFFEVFHAGKWVTMSTIFNYLYQNVDDMVVVRFLNTTSLGLYQMAYKIAMLPITEVSDVIAKVTFPIYSKIADDKVRLRSAFLKTVSVNVIFSVPFVFVFLAFPYQIILILLGNEWVSAASVLQILAIFGLTRALTVPAIIVLLALKRQDIVAKITFSTFLILAATVVPFINNWGIFGAGLSATIASITMLPFAYIYALKCLKK